MNETGAYRVFISYSHENKDLAGRIVGALQKNGLTPMWDEDFSGGFGFPELIKRYIAHSHVFLPIITQDSSLRGWVHQEIGYAMALNVPVLPVVKEALPKEMIAELHAVRLSDDEAEDAGVIARKLSKQVFENIVEESIRVSKPLYECAELHEDRTFMMADYAHQIRSLGHFGKVRQKGALSSFHIPDLPEHDHDWQRRYGESAKSTHMFKLLREEHRELKRHAEKCGCDLIINPSLDYKAYGPDARKLRLQTLVGCLSAMDKEPVRVAINTDVPNGENLTAGETGLLHTPSLADWEKAIPILFSPGMLPA